jgi:hypothetical protein
VVVQETGSVATTTAIMVWWPPPPLKSLFQRKAPPLHRALGEPQDEKTSFLVEELASRRRVRKRDDFKRNALHAAVRALCGPIRPFLTHSTNNGSAVMFQCAISDMLHYVTVCWSLSFSRSLSLSLYFILIFKNEQCLNQPSLELVQMLVELYPKAVEECDKAGRLPLHTACANRASLDVIQYLVGQYAEGVLEMTDRGVRILTSSIKDGRAVFDVSVLNKDLTVTALWRLFHL